MADRSQHRPPSPEPLPLPVVDNHTHLDYARSAEPGIFPAQEQIRALLDQATAANVPRSVQIGCDLAAAQWTVQAVTQSPELIGGVALHPTEATKHAAAQQLDDAFAQIEQLAGHPRIRVVGETGLDYNWVHDTAGRAAQADSFRRHIGLAKRLDKVLQIHDRDAHSDVLRILEEEGAPARTVFHCFSGDAEMAKVCADRGYYLSFAGTVTFTNAPQLREALAAVPPSQVLVETDAPYLTPMPYRGRPNAGYLVPITVRAMAQVLNRNLETVCGQLDEATRAVYGDW